LAHLQETTPTVTQERTFPEKTAKTAAFKAIFDSNRRKLLRDSKLFLEFLTRSAMNFRLLE